jgi:hypothetical protein
MHSRSRARDLQAARRIGRHRGFGKRKGTADARMPRYAIFVTVKLPEEVVSGFMMDNRMLTVCILAKLCGCEDSEFSAVFL